MSGSIAPAPTGVKRKQPVQLMADVPQAITVVVKVRPPNTREIELAKSSPQTNDLDFYTLSDDSQAITFDNTAPPNKPLWNRFDQVFDSESSQADIFQGTALPVVSACMQGYNGCLMAYGQTGSGKTWTMTGPKDALVDQSRQHLQGIIPRALDQLFTTITNTTEIKFQVQCSYFEIYNETLRDLLLTNTNNPPNLTITTYGAATYVAGVTMVDVNSAAEALAAMERGFAKRHTAATKMNNESSRSHAIFTVYLTSQTNDDGVANNNSNAVIQRQSKLHFVDLAGSESSAKTGAKGETQREGANINASLLNLGKVIRELAQHEQQVAALKKKTPSTTIPIPHFSYRGSKLTHILQDSFGKGNPLCLIANISPSRDNIQESKSTLTFASNARSLPKTVIKPKAKVISKSENSTGPSDEAGDDKIGGEYGAILRARCGNKAEMLDGMLEQVYMIAMLWQRQRKAQFLLEQQQLSTQYEHGG